MRPSDHEKRCFTYCGDDTCDCEARELGANIVPAEGWKPMTVPDTPIPGKPDDLVERLNDGVIWHEGDNEVHLDATHDLMIEAASLIQTQGKEIERLHERLEDNHVYTFDVATGEDRRVEVEPGSIPDGIECRDETIRLLEEDRERVRACAALEGGQDRRLAAVAVSLGGEEASDV